VEDLARVVCDTATKFSRDFDKLTALVHSLLTSLKVLERDAKVSRNVQWK